MKDRYRRIRPLRSVTAVCAVALLAAACEGSNLFEGEDLVGITLPVITEIDAPSTAVPGSTFEYSVTATSDVGVISIDVRLVHGIEFFHDTVTFDPPESTVSVVGEVTLPLPRSDSILLIHARAVQVGGRASQVKTDTVRITS
jgi:hypothetical protein